MTDAVKPLFERDFLRAEFAYEYQAFTGSPEESALLDRLRAWDARRTRGESEIEGAFIARFFEDTWGYRPDGSAPAWTLQQQFAVPGAGQGGQGGSADLALGHFGEGGTRVPQVLCEFKGVGADLDRAQNRKGNTRSPARQALDYLTFARRGVFDSAAVLPRFAIVTDMNQFRLYWYDRAPQSFVAFRIQAPVQAGLRAARSTTPRGIASGEARTSTSRKCASCWSRRPFPRCGYRSTSTAPSTPTTCG